MKKTFLIPLFILLLSGCGVNPAAQSNVQTQTPETENNNQSASTNEKIKATSTTATSTAEEKSNLNDEKNMTDQNASTSSEVTSSSEKSNSDYALIETSMGNIKIRLNNGLAPISVENFKKYINKEFYNGTLFHRVIPSFMIQGGGFDTKKVQKTTDDPIKNEAKNGLLNKRGTIAMARTMVVDSATSQFFINLVDNEFLNYKDDNNYGYAIFGEITEGMDVVDEIAKVKTGANGDMSDWPIDNVVIKSIKLLDK
jgi:cyclophilin family peptidyl-prolyl cis-trans isomerase